jgi:hypothetical protein
VAVVVEAVVHVHPSSLGWPETVGVEVEVVALMRNPPLCPWARVEEVGVVVEAVVRTRNPPLCFVE